MNVNPGSDRTITADEFVQWLRSDEKTISYTTVEGNVSIAGDDLYKKSINYCVFNGRIVLSPSKVNYLVFENSRFHKVVDISISEIQSHVQFENCDAKKVKFESCSGGHYFLHELRCSEDLSFRNIERFNHISLTDVVVEKDLKFFHLNEEDAGDIFLHGTKVLGELMFMASREIPMVGITQGFYEKINVNDNIKRLLIHGGTEELTINLLSFGQFNRTGETVLENIKIGTLRMNQLHNQNASFKFSDVEVTDVWEMRYSSPNKLQAVNLTLTNCEVCFDNTLLSECVLSNIDWPTKYKLQSKHSDDKNRHASLREAYRQLKHASNRNSNHIDALSFYRNEMEAYREFMKGNHEAKWEDKFILFISWIFSNHGQSFVRPIAWLLGMHVLLFSILLLTNYNHFEFPATPTWSATLDGIGEYFSLLNPAHRSPNMKGIQLFIDFFMRLSSGFFIYHIIRASRKFAKV